MYVKNARDVNKKCMLNNKLLCLLKNMGNKCGFLGIVDIQKYVKGGNVSI